jgi:hypothetical protein
VASSSELSRAFSTGNGDLNGLSSSFQELNLSRYNKVATSEYHKKQSRIYTLASCFRLQLNTINKINTVILPSHGVTGTYKTWPMFSRQGRDPRI